MPIDQERSPRGEHAQCFGAALTARSPGPAFALALDTCVFVLTIRYAYEAGRTSRAGTLVGFGDPKASAVVRRWVPKPVGVSRTIGQQYVLRLVRAHGTSGRLGT
ncbi:hypothetical protein PV721_26340 [Streptomyces sp. MB09-01]|uniref:hypothetical protein n=1 Tax=Streptomyces sp. MB09-01 TaxID=3028666 RepID=UPI0029A54620|nr:hypothetical protein [Streptomyces sp. MB09-01]MDX3537820.1 hypothetical protein [Streptomyces sp. MB09-01]